MFLAGIHKLMRRLASRTNLRVLDESVAQAARDRSAVQTEESDLGGRKIDKHVIIEMAMPIRRLAGSQRHFPHPEASVFEQKRCCHMV
jgi:hypothetical protein